MTEAESIALIAGLGNPGPEHAETRHNAGFRFLEILADFPALRLESRFSARIGKCQVAGRELIVMAPQTFMNRSGDAVAAVARYHRIAPAQILVVHDDLDLPAGVVRVKRGGGHGGHNGLRDIVAKLGSPDFIRLRIGIGHPGSASQVESYVLRRAPVAEREATDAAIRRAVDHLDDVIHGRLERAMNSLHVH